MFMFMFMPGMAIESKAPVILAGMLEGGATCCRRAQEGDSGLALQQQQQPPKHKCHVVRVNCGSSSAATAVGPSDTCVPESFPNLKHIMRCAVLDTFNEV